MHLLVWSAVVWGVTMIVTTSKIFASLRDAFPHASAGDYVTRKNAIGTLLRCPLCFAFWVGLFFAAFGYTPVAIATPWLPAPAAFALTLVASGAAASAVSWTWHVVLVRLGSFEL